MRNLLVTLLATSSVLSFSAAAGGMSLAEKDKAFEQYIASEKLESVEKINAKKITSSTSLSESYVIINAQHNGNYLVKTAQKCDDMDQQAVSLSRVSDLSLDKKTDHIVKPGSKVGECDIESMYPITWGQRKYLTNVGRG